MVINNFQYITNNYLQLNINMKYHYKNILQQDWHKVHYIHSNNYYLIHIYDHLGKNLHIMEDLKNYFNINIQILVSKIRHIIQVQIIQFNKDILKNKTLYIFVNCYYLNKTYKLYYKYIHFMVQNFLHYIYQNKYYFQNLYIYKYQSLNNHLYINKEQIINKCKEHNLDMNLLHTLLH